MYWMERKEDRDMLRTSGFNEAEIESLPTHADYRRFEFVRWLVATGRLTDQLA